MDNLTKEQRRRNMQNIRSCGTAPERKLARCLRTNKAYFAQNVTSLPGKPDIVFRRKKIAVFIDSDFWHGHPKRFIMPKTNIRYWRDKINNNIKRDKAVNKILKEKGWKVIRLWDFDVKNKTDKCLAKISRALL